MSAETLKSCGGLEASFAGDQGTAYFTHPSVPVETFLGSGICLFLCMCLHVCMCAEEARRGCQIHWVRRGCELPDMVLGTEGTAGN